MFAVIFICGNLFLRIAGKTVKIRTHKNFMPHIKWGNPPVHVISHFNLITLNDRCGDLPHVTSAIWGPSLPQGCHYEPGARDFPRLQREWPPATFIGK